VLLVEICVKGYIDEGWSEWFEDMTIKHGGEAQTFLSGGVIDQSALYSLINRLSRLGLSLVSVAVTERPNYVHEE